MRFEEESEFRPTTNGFTRASPVLGRGICLNIFYVFMYDMLSSCSVLDMDSCRALIRGENAAYHLHTFIF